MADGRPGWPTGDVEVSGSGFTAGEAVFAQAKPKIVTSLGAVF